MLSVYTMSWKMQKNSAIRMLHTVLYAIFVAVTLLVLQIKIIIFLTQNRIGEKTTVLLSDDKNLKQEKRN